MDRFKILALLCVAGMFAALAIMPAQKGSVLNPVTHMIETPLIAETEIPPLKKGGRLEINNKPWHYKIECLVPYNTRVYYTKEFEVKDGAIWFYEEKTNALTVLSWPFEAKAVQQ